MATKAECCLCAPYVEGQSRGDRLCIECLNKAAAYDDLREACDDAQAGMDDLKGRLRSATRRIMSLRSALSDDDTVPVFGTTYSYVAGRLTSILEAYCGPELREQAAALEADAEFRRQAEAARLHKPSTLNAIIADANSLGDMCAKLDGLLARESGPAAHVRRVG